MSDFPTNHLRLKEGNKLENLRKLRQERNLSQRALANLMGISQQSINKYETGKTQPDINMLMTLAEFFHTSIDYLVGYTDNAEPHRLITDLKDSEYETLTPYRADKMKRGKGNSLPLLREAPPIDAPNIYDTTPTERYHLTMYRKLTPRMQQSLDAFLENFVPDDGFLKYKKGNQKNK